MSLLLSPTTIEQSNYRRHKAGYKIPPWWDDTQKLRALMVGAWSDIGGTAWLQQVLDAIQKGDEEAVNKLLKTMNTLGDEFAASVGDSAEAILSTTQLKAHAANMFAGKAVLDLARLIDYPSEYQDYLAHTQAKQILEFARTFPERILHPEIVRQLEYARASDLTTSVDQARIAERLERFSLRPEQYWESASDVHVARVWHCDNLILAGENGIVSCQIIGIWDKRTCSVCKHLIGHTVEVKQAVSKIQSELESQDADKYVEAWKFPRIGDVDNISAEELEAKGYFPPFHGRCRCSLVWLTR